MTRIFAAALGLLLASPALAQAGPAPAAPAAPAADGTILRAQGEEMVRSAFQELDVNHDGVLDAGEQQAILDAAKTQGAPPEAIASLQRVFTEGRGADGRVTLAAFVGARMAAFDKADTNHDGKLDPAEQAAARAAAAQKSH